MSSKKIMIGLLSLGVLVIIVLLGVGYNLSSKIRNELQDTLNAKLEKAVQDYDSSNQALSIRYNPFVCSGVSSYQCVSKYIIFTQTDTQEDLVKISDLTFKVDDISTGSIQVSLKSPKISSEGLDKIVEKNQNQEFSSLYNAFKPNAFECSEKNSLLDKHTGEVISHNQCTITSESMEYSYNFSTRVKSPEIVDKTILNAMIFYYSKNSLENSNDFDLAFDEASVSLTSDKLKDVLYPIFKANYQLQNPKNKVAFNDEIYKDALEDVRGFVGFGLMMGGMLGGPYEGALMEFVQGMEGMAMQKVSSVKLSLVSKENPAPYFKLQTFLDILTNIDKPSMREKMFEKVFNNYDMIAKIYANEAK